MTLAWQVHEGVLTKVCRGKNKPYMFWLLTDCLIYATHLPGGSYTFNRWMELTEMRVRRIIRMSTSQPNASL